MERASETVDRRRLAIK